MIDDRNKARLWILIGHESLRISGEYCHSAGFDPWSDLPATDRWLSARLAEGDDKAAYALASLLSLGFFGDERRSEAFSFAEIAAESGRAPAILLLAELAEQRPDKVAMVMPLMEQAAGLGYGRALNKLAHYYAAGWHVEANPLRSAELMLLAAKAGDAASLFSVGHNLLHSSSGEEIATGIEYIRLAADQNNESALSALAQFYELGRYGLPVDRDAARILRLRHAQVTEPYAFLGEFTSPGDDKADRHQP
jgi:TPR repeat protein